ncbi:MAG: hypothetical protein ACREX3_21290, partial [Gammaproteobacteria bacterium]
AEIGSALDAEEKIQVGIYSNGFDVPESPDEWHVLSGQVSKAILRELNRPIESFGAVQGIIHALYKESDPKPYFNLRELSRKDKLIKCFYDNSIYSEIARALQRRENVVHAEGRITLSRSTGSVIDMDVSRIEAIKPLSQEEFESFFGSAPDLTGERSTVEYLRSVWNGDGER